MKPAAHHWLVCLGVITAALWTIGWLQPTKADATQTDPQSPPKLDCGLNESIVKREDGKFGYPVDRKKILDGLYQAFVREVQIELQRYDPLGYVRFERRDLAPAIGSRPRRTAWNQDVTPCWCVEPVINRRLQAKQFKAWFDNHRVEKRCSTYEGYFRRKGFDAELCSEEPVEIAYRRIAADERPLLKDCFNQISQKFGLGQDQDEVFKFLLAAFQEMPKAEPPIEENGTFRSGFWIPLRVLKESMGDCDSKATALCALWQKPEKQIALFRYDRIMEDKTQPQHVYLGIEGNPTTTDDLTERIGIRTYILHEVLYRRKPNFKRDFIRKESVKPFCMTDDCGTPKRKECTPPRRREASPAEAILPICEPPATTNPSNASRLSSLCRSTSLPAPR